MVNPRWSIPVRLGLAMTIGSIAIVLAVAPSPDESLDAAHAQPPPADVSPIRLNTIGYLPTAAKRATIAAPSERFAIVRVADGASVFEARVTGPVLNEDTQEELYAADFSSLVEPGEYRLEVPGVGQSEPFRIAADIYREPFRTVTRAMYLWRCGTAVRGEYEGQEFQHAACHLEDGRLDLIGQAGEHRDATGGWHDAGDYNKYVCNVGVTAGCMFRAWADFQPIIAGVDLEIPESGGPLPDFLAELKWELDWLLKMQADDGSVYHKLSAVHYCGFIMPEQEADQRYFGEWGSAATANFVALTATAARHYRPHDPAYAARCLAAARRSYEYLVAHPDDHPPKPEGFQTSGYTSPDWDERLWAAAELWETTGDVNVLADFEARAQLAQPASRWQWQNSDDPGNAPGATYQWQVASNWDWGNVANLALITYLSSERSGRNAQLVSKIETSLLETADRIVEQRNGHGYGRPLGTRYYWGCNGTVARQTVVLHAAQRFAPKPEYRETARDALNHLFGRNCHGRSYVTGLGQRPPMLPHDRRAAADGVAEPWPGYLVGGPLRNARDWNDEQDDYRTNEIAINWNGALIYALAAALEESE